jgi:hypothetical protein
VTEPDQNAALNVEAGVVSLSLLRDNTSPPPLQR